MIELIARRFRLLGEPVRLRLLRQLEAGEHMVNELAEVLGSNQANISRHLTAMSDAGLLHRRREGTCTYYSIADPVVFKLCELVCGSAKEHVRVQMDALAGRVRQ
jgi:DNA-binding transcriptional ArsR family regulator